VRRFGNASTIKRHALISSPGRFSDTAISNPHTTRRTLKPLLTLAPIAHALGFAARRHSHVLSIRGWLIGGDIQ